jgi:hypothetical protein
MYHISFKQLAVGMFGTAHLRLYQAYEGKNISTIKATFGGPLGWAENRFGGGLGINNWWLL